MGLFDKKFKTLLDAQKAAEKKLEWQIGDFNNDFNLLYKVAMKEECPTLSAALESVSSTVKSFGQASAQNENKDSKWIANSELVFKAPGEYMLDVNAGLMSSRRSIVKSHTNHLETHVKKARVWVEKLPSVEGNITKESILLWLEKVGKRSAYLQYALEIDFERKYGSNNS